MEQVWSAQFVTFGRPMRRDEMWRVADQVAQDSDRFLSNNAQE